MSRPERPEHLLDGVTNADPTELWAVYAASLIKAEAYMDAIEADLAEAVGLLREVQDHGANYTYLRQPVRDRIDAFLSRMEEPHE